MKELFLKYGMGAILGLISGFLVAMLLSCSFDYDNTYVNEPPEYIGEPCSNENEKRRLVYGDFTLCIECLESVDGLAWFEIDCNEFEEGK